MKVSFLYDQGSAPYREDGLFLAEPLFGVLDGVSAPYALAGPARKFQGMSGGEFVARTVEQCFVYLRSPKNPSALRDLVLEVNQEVRRQQQAAGVPFNAGELAGAAFAVARVGGGYVEVVQAGDCFALWAMKDGSVGITRNQVRAHDTVMNAEIEHIQRKVASELFGVVLEEATPEERSQIRGEMWNRFSPRLKEARRQDVNSPASPRGYGFMNGDPRLKEMMVFLTIPRSELRALLLFSDGMVPWEAMKGMTDEEIAHRVYTDYLEGGLAHLLRIARGIECRVANVNYMDSAEATAIALNFDEGMK